MKTKNIYYGILAAVLVCVLGIIFLGGKQDIEDAGLESAGINATGRDSSQEIILPEKLDGPDWGLKAEACRQGGYDLQRFAGKRVTLNSYSTEDRIGGGKATAWVVSDGNEIACIYRTAEGIIPGVYSAR